jgi:predicted CoA-binding protein
MTTDERIHDFLSSSRYAVVGASTDRSKYGNKALRCYLQHGREVVAIHPREREIEGVVCHASLSQAEPLPEAVSVITPAAVSYRVIEEAHRLGIGRVWLQPGAEDDATLARADELGLEVIAGGPCLLVVLGFRDV